MSIIIIILISLFLNNTKYTKSRLINNIKYLKIYTNSIIFFLLSHLAIPGLAKTGDVSASSRPGSPPSSNVSPHNAQNQKGNNNV